MSTASKTPVAPIRVLTPQETKQVSGGPAGYPGLSTPNDPKLGAQPAR
jgi:hypothetical protein